MMRSLSMINRYRSGMWNMICPKTLNCDFDLWCVEYDMSQNIEL